MRQLTTKTELDLILSPSWQQSNAMKSIRTHSPATPSVAPTQQLCLPLERLSVRIPMAIQMTGIGRSKLYELIASGDIETAKVGASTLIIVASLKRLIEARRR